MKRTTWLYIAGGAAATVLAFAWAFAPRPLDVEVAEVTRGPFEAYIEEDAKTRVRDRFVVSAPLVGRLSRITLREGDGVEAGAALATLAPALPPLLDERTLREQRERVEIALANVDRVSARIARAKVGVQQAASEVGRSEQLARQGYVAAAKLETDRLALQAAQREFDAASEEGQVARHEVAQARSALAAVTGGETRRVFTLRAPVAGKVLRIVQPSEAVVALGTPLVELGDTARMEVVAELPTAQALQVSPGHVVAIEGWGGPAALQGRVRLTEPGAFTKVSALGVEEQRVRVLIDITSDPVQWQALGDGYRATVRIITLATKDAVCVPVSAVFPLPQGGYGVFRLAGGRARVTPVDVVARNGTLAWARSGVAPGDQVIAYPPASVADGKRVRARPGGAG
ncbi:MAG: efflux RND transporter periplasmic adaptor subunit [Pseudomonadota bacterium]